MSSPKSPPTVNTLFSTLHERAKELSCLYKVEEMLSQFDHPLEEVFRRVIEAIPPGWQYPDCCQVRIVYGDETYESPDFEDTPHVHCSDIRVQDALAGRLCVSYKRPTPESDCGPFLKGEVKLIQTIADRIGHFILHQRLTQMFRQMNDDRRTVRDDKAAWHVALDLLRNTDPNLFIRVSRKMMNYLGWRGVSEARALLHRLGEDRQAEGVVGEANAPQERGGLERFVKLSDETFRIASANLSDEDIMGRI